ncbi:hypothetical protein BGW38_007287 [Lunasporangiospora selenospora]|uniref:Sister chromatid cohesion protein PDS5 n=1 Tax=Lunasporangiospora selenospora TaxID=979761 RepID=A0A9P6FYZ1_9FUNG|nr:hypothetical protein BGW38_007287 [Lunasporangiospora selenospora]
MVTPVSKKLQFHQKLGGSAAELLKKVKELHFELKDMEQESVDQASLTAVSKQLIEPAVVNHKDKGVRAYAACCIADMLRLYAPDAPYSSNNLKTIFMLFVNELRNIANPNGTYYNAHFYLLESLSAVKSIVLITDLKNANELIIDLFRNTFDDVRPQLAKNIQICMSELLQHVLDEAKNLPQEIVDIILAQFLHRQKFDNPAAYRLACDLVNACSDKLQRYVFQYFLDIISTANKEGLTTKELEDIKTIHRLIVELNKAAPSLLLNVIPQLEEELKITNVTIRTLATKSLGQMFAEKTSQLPAQYESTWKAWLQRRNDKAAQVRIAWLESLTDLVQAHASLSKELNEGLIDKVIDPDEKVRATACKIVGGFDYETSLHHIQKQTLVQVGHRCRDKKKSVAREAIKALSVLFDQAYPEIENGTQACVSHFGWMPSAVLHAIYINDTEVFSFVDYAVLTKVFPPHGNVTVRAQRLLTTFSLLDDRSRAGLLSLFVRCVEARSGMTALLRLLDQRKSLPKDSEDEELNKKLDAIISHLSDRLPDPTASSVQLFKFVKLFDEQFERSITNCMDYTLTLKQIRKAGKETLTRLENMSPATVETFSILIQRISMTVINKEVITSLVRSIGQDSEYRQTSAELLKSIAFAFPAIFEDHLSEMMSLLHDRESAGVTESLQTLADYAKHSPKSLPVDSKAKSTLQAIVKSGTAAQSANAVTILASILGNDTTCREIAKTAAARLDVDSIDLLKDLSILSKMVLYCPEAFEAVSSEVVSFIVKKLLMSNIPDQETTYGAEEDWVEKSELDSYSLSKILGLKVLLNRSIVMASDATVAQETTRPLFKLIWTLISQEGELVEAKNTNKVMKSHLRLNAAKFALKLTRNRPIYERMVSVSEYKQLALVIQDPVYKVRHGFASRIMKYLRFRELHVRYLAVLVLAAHEPEMDWRFQIRKFLMKNQEPGLFVVVVAVVVETVGSNMMWNELTLVRVLHLLANHPDFVVKAPESNICLDTQDTHTVNDLNLVSKYIEFYLASMAKSENISLIFHIASLLKTVRFAEPTEHTQNLYILSDMTQYIIQEKSKIHNWTLTSYPGQVKLPRELFVPLGQAELNAEISTKNYLSQEWVRAREHKVERKPKVSGGSGGMERKMGQAVKRRSRSPSPGRIDGADGAIEDDEENNGEGSSTWSSRATKRIKSKKMKASTLPKEPTRRMASRAAKSNAIYAEEGSEGENESDEDDS